MNPAVVIDTGPRGLLTQRAGIREADACRAWFRQHLAAGTPLLIPEISDYELRRELLRAGKTAGVARLDALIASRPASYVPITTEMMRHAAEFWAAARRSGQPTAPDAALDGDAILAAQVDVWTRAGRPAVIATTNVGHLSRFVAAQLWSDIPSAG